MRVDDGIVISYRDPCDVWDWISTVPALTNPMVLDHKVPLSFEKECNSKDISVYILPNMSMDSYTKNEQANLMEWVLKKHKFQMNWMLLYVCKEFEKPKKVLDKIKYDVLLQTRSDAKYCVLLEMPSDAKLYTIQWNEYRDVLQMKIQKSLKKKIQYYQSELGKLDDVYNYSYFKMKTNAIILYTRIREYDIALQHINDLVENKLRDGNARDVVLAEKNTIEAEGLPWEKWQNSFFKMDAWIVEQAEKNQAISEIEFMVYKVVVFAKIGLLMENYEIVVDNVRNGMRDIQQLFCSRDVKNWVVHGYVRVLYSMMDVDAGNEIYIVDTALDAYQEWNRHEPNSMVDQYSIHDIVDQIILYGKRAGRHRVAAKFHHIAAIRAMEKQHFENALKHLDIQKMQYEQDGWKVLLFPILQRMYTCQLKLGRMDKAYETAWNMMHPTFNPCHTNIMTDILEWKEHRQLKCALIPYFMVSGNNNPNELHICNRMRNDIQIFSIRVEVIEENSIASESTSMELLPDDVKLLPTGKTTFCIDDTKFESFVTISSIAIYSKSVTFFANRSSLLLQHDTSFGFMLKPRIDPKQLESIKLDVYAPKLMMPFIDCVFEIDYSANLKDAALEVRPLNGFALKSAHQNSTQLEIKSSTPMVYNLSLPSHAGKIIMIGESHASDLNIEFTLLYGNQSICSRQCLVPIAPPMTITTQPFRQDNQKYLVQVIIKCNALVGLTLLDYYVVEKVELKDVVLAENGTYLMAISLDTTKCTNFHLTISYQLENSGEIVNPVSQHVHSITLPKEDPIACVVNVSPILADLPYYFQGSFIGFQLCISNRTIIDKMYYSIAFEQEGTWAIAGKQRGWFEFVTLSDEALFEFQLLPLVCGTLSMPIVSIHDQKGNIMSSVRHVYTGKEVTIYSIAP